MAEPGFWDNQEKAQKLISETNLLKEKRDSFLALEKDLTDEETALELLRLEADADLQKDTEDQLAKLQEEFHQYELNLLLSGEYDDHNALMEIHPGAGGTEAMDWGNMLLRMYQRYCDSRGLKFEVNNFEPGDEAGLKSVRVRISGKNAYGLLKSEHGVHRLVRISFFQRQNSRHHFRHARRIFPLGCIFLIKHLSGIFIEQYSCICCDAGYTVWQRRSCKYRTLQQCIENNACHKNHFAQWTQPHHPLETFT